MTIEQITDKIAYAYHLTAEINYPVILHERKIYSTQRLTEIGMSAEERDKFLRERRADHFPMKFNGQDIVIRDQRPISMKVLQRSLTPGWTAEQFISTLNSRAFFWPSIQRLKRHFARYEEESPLILRFKVSDLIRRNEDRIELARLNTGATRCSPYYDGNAPTRGQGTFSSIENTAFPVREIAEITVKRECLLPNSFWKSGSPDGPWVRVELE